MTIKEKIIELMSMDNYEPSKVDELNQIFKLNTKSEFKAFKKIIKDMENEGIIIKDDNERYGLIEDSGFIVGEIQGNEKGFGFVIPDNKELDDIFIAPDNMLNAFNGDKVLARITKIKDDDRRSEGEIVRILKRKFTEIVGTFQKSKSFGFVVPDDRKINYDVFIPKNQINNAKADQKVVVEISKWPTQGRNPEGKIIEILGYMSDKGTDILSIVKQMGLPYEFSNKTISDAENINQEVTDDELKSRLDLRELNTFTIDGIDAKDLDDAISIEKLDNGNYELGVHIADVSHYVREKSNIDKEAYERGNSVYLLDRVIPMLPEELSNGICSLNPDMDRLTLSVFMELDEKGNLVKYSVNEAVINSKRRLVYEDVSDFIEDINKSDSLIGIENEILLLNELAIILYEKRKRRGSIDFNFPETKILLDNMGKPIEIKDEDRRIANKIIEECMLVCNETIAENMYWAEIPFLYRIHEEPSEEKISEFNKIIHNFGYMIKGTQELHPKEFQKLSYEIAGKKEETLINTLMLRSLKKARYSDTEDIHFGLAAKYYCHFTAPIRRYADLEIHRIIKLYINGKLNAKKVASLDDFLPKVATHVSKSERVAEEAEREVEDLKMAEYMLERIGNEYDGIISSLTNFGIFVQLENTIEGLVRYQYLRDDYYHFDEDSYKVIGERTKKIYNLGDAVRIKVIDADISKRTIDFMILDDKEQDNWEE